MRTPPTLSEVAEMVSRSQRRDALLSHFYALDMEQELYTQFPFIFPPTLGGDSYLASFIDEKAEGTYKL